MYRKFSFPSDHRTLHCLLYCLVLGYILWSCQLVWPPVSPFDDGLSLFFWHRPFLSFFTSFNINLILDVTAWGLPFLGSFATLTFHYNSRSVTWETAFKFLRQTSQFGTHNLNDDRDISRMASQIIASFTPVPLMPTAFRASVRMDLPSSPSPPNVRQVERSWSIPSLHVAELLQRLQLVHELDCFSLFNFRIFYRRVNFYHHFVFFFGIGFADSAAWSSTSSKAVQ